MYIPRHFEETRVEILHQLIHTHPLGTLVTLTANGLEANHIPFIIDSEPVPFGTLRGHIARANPLWRHFSQETEALVVFQGPDAYISPSWYPTKQETGKVVPTWNYAVVHAHGPLRMNHDRTWLREFVERLTNRHEAARGTPWKVADAPGGYIDELLGSIVGLELPVTRLAGKWKMSQNRPVRDQEGAAEGLMGEGGESATAVARMLGRT
jgi:transcriptional regulator